MPKIKINLKSPLDKHQDNLTDFLENNVILKMPHNSAFLDKYKDTLQKDLLSGVISTEFSQLLLEGNKNFQFITPLYSIRDFYIHSFGFTLISEPFLKDLVSYLQDKVVVEIGAGTGFLSKQLNEKGINIKAVDESPLEKNQYGFSQNHFPVFEDNGKDYLNSMGKSFDTVILSWPNYDTPFATEVLNEMHPNQELIYIGEDYGGCTADDSFWDLLEKKAILNEDATSKLRQNFSSFPSIHDRPFVFKIIQ